MRPHQQRNQQSNQHPLSNDTGTNSASSPPTTVVEGNFRLLNGLLTQMERILEINALQEVTKAVVEAPWESLVIGQV